jgi:hypothetical protein
MGDTNIILMLFENKELKIISRPKRDEITGSWRNLLNSGFITFALCHIWFNW